MNLGAMFTNDAVIKAIVPQVERAIEPFFIEARAKLLSKLSGPQPAGFASLVRRHFAFSDEDVQRLWEAACESIL